MTCYCKECKLVFPNRIANCPNCGGRLTNDATSIQQLSGMGYRIICFEKKESVSSPVMSTEPEYDHSAEESDIMSGLMSSFEAQHPLYNNQSTSTNNDYYQHNHHSSDFFSDSSNEIDHIQAPEIRNIEIFNDNDESYETIIRQNRRLENQMRRSRRRYSIMNAISNIRFDYVIRIIFLIFIVFLVITIWNARYEILNFLLTSIFPLFLIIYMIIYLLRALFTL